MIVIAKEPRPGRVKTRLQAEFAPEQASRLAAASLADTLSAVLASRSDRRVIALEGSAGPWLPAGFEVIGQGAGGLDLRLAAAFEQVFATAPAAGSWEAGSSGSSGPVLLVGMDTPQLTPALLEPDWNGADAVLGLSEDGGFWAIGLREPCPAAFAGVPMSTPQTGAAQLARLRSLGLRVRMLPVLRDVDTPADAAAVARLVPGSRFAQLYRQFVGAAPAGGAVLRPSRSVPRLHPLELYAAALRGEPVRVELPGGHSMPLTVEHWLGAADSADRMMLNRCEGTVIDLGCGPGRLVEALAESGTPALGIDICPDAVQLTAERGASVLRRAVEGPLPAEGRWGTVLLADGNLGIGGDPEALLYRCRQLLRPAGLLLVEADPQDQVDERHRLTLIDASGRRAHPMPWARLGRTPLTALAGRIGFLVIEEWRVAGRVFLALRAS